MIEAALSVIAVAQLVQAGLAIRQTVRAEKQHRATLASMDHIVKASDRLADAPSLLPMFLAQDPNGGSAGRRS